MTGFSDSIKFGDITDILEDDGVALDVDLSDPSQAPADPYWRMVVLDDYHDGGFKLSAKLRQAFLQERTSANIVSGLRTPRGSPTWTFYLESGVSRYLPVLGNFQALRFRDAQSYRYSSDLALVALRDEPATMTAYRVEGMAADSAELPDRVFAGRWRNREMPRGIDLQLGLGGLPPADRAALLQLGAEIGPVGPDAGAYARRASAWLRSRHGYSLSPRIPPGPGDPLVRWMKSREAGHCELFAGALVLVARSAGIPARVVTGFKGGTWNAYSGNYTIRNSDAHAWAEVWDAQRGGVAPGGSPVRRRGRQVRREGGRRARRAHGPELVGPAQQPARLLVPADRQLRPAVAGRHHQGRQERDRQLGQVAALGDRGHCAQGPVLVPRPVGPWRGFSGWR